MAYAEWFDTEENKILMAVCARKLIANSGIGSVVWGVINILIGAVATIAWIGNAGILILGVIMLGAGVRALTHPTHTVLLIETIVAILLFLWNLSIAVVNYVKFDTVTADGLIFPLIIAVMFYNNYRKLRHLREHIENVQPEMVANTKKMCKTLVKVKLKTSPDVAETSDRKCRVQLLPNRAFFIQKDLMRAFVASRNEIAATIKSPEAKNVRLDIEHPLGKLTCAFDRKNSEKIRAWLTAPTEPPPVPVV